MAYSGNILVTIEALSQKSSEFSTKSQEVKTLHDDMLNRITSLLGSWEGEGAQAYSSKFSALKTSMDTIFRMIQEHVTDLSTMCDTYQQAETAAVNAVENLPAGNL